MLNQLKNLGLSEKEAKVYLAMLELGPATIMQIAQKAEINRPTAYVQIESLKKMGLVSTQMRGKKQFFIAENPEHFTMLIEKEKKMLEEKKEELQKILPELKTLFNLSGQKPIVRYFEGKNGLLRMKEEFLKTRSKEILAISPIDDVFTIFPDHQTAYTMRRVQKKIRAKLIYTSSRGKIFKEENKEILSETKFVPSDKLSLTVDITIFDDKVALSALKGKIGGTIIQHLEIANSFRALFNLMWVLVSK